MPGDSSMLICLDCYLRTEPEQKDEPFSLWELADKVYGQCDTCQRSTLCAEL